MSDISQSKKKKIMHTFIGNLQFFFISIMSFSMFILSSFDDDIENTHLFIYLLLFVIVSYALCIWGRILDEEYSIERIS